MNIIEHPIWILFWKNPWADYLRRFIDCRHYGSDAERDITVLLVLTNQIADSLLPRATPSLNEVVYDRVAVKHDIVDMAIGLHHGNGNIIIITSSDKMSTNKIQICSISIQRR